VSETDSLELKKRARRRLVGACALAIVAAIVLPMVMDGEPDTPLQEIQVTIPDRDSESRPISAGGLRSAPQVIPRPDDGRAEDELAVAESDIEPSLPEAPAPAPEEVEPSTPEATGERAAAGETDERADEDANGEEERVRAILEGRAEMAQARADESPANGGFAVQVGAFSDESAAERLTKRLEEQGFESFAVPGETITRVRVGPYASRSEAESAAEELMSLGMEGVVIRTR